MSPPTAQPAAAPRVTVSYREATPEDGPVVFELVETCGTLERNTGYAYVLLADHFRDTTILAESDGEVVGFVAAYRPPTHPDTVFVWQVGVHPKMRGRGLARSILDALVGRPGCEGVRYLEATVTPSNAASRRLFESFARRHGADAEWSAKYPAAFFGGNHEPEDLVRIGPLNAGGGNDR